MSAPSPVLAAQTEALLGRVRLDRDARIEGELRAGQEAVAATLAAARRLALARVRAALREERALHERALAERRAALETESRQRLQRLLGELVVAAWQRLPESLAARWRRPEDCERWAAAATREALAVLPDPGAIALEIDAGSDLALRARIEGAARRGGLPEAKLHEVEGLGAGLRLRGGAACVDATVNGLLASREVVEAELLADIEARLAARRGRA